MVQKILPTFRRRGDQLAGYVDPPVSDAAVREAHGEPLEPAEAAGLLALDMWGHPFNDFGSALLGRPIESVAQAIWLRRDKYKAYLPKAVAEAKFLRELLDALLNFISQWRHA